MTETPGIADYPDDLGPAPLVSEDLPTRYRAMQTLWHNIHEHLNSNRSPDATLEKILERIGRMLGADRAYTFSVASDRRHTSCTYEWTSRPEYDLKSFLQNIDQAQMSGWLDRFKTSKSILIPDVDNPPPDLAKPAGKFKRDLIRSIYVYGFFDEGHLTGYLGIDYIEKTCPIDDTIHEVLFQIASTLNLYILRHETLELWSRLSETMPSALFIKDADNDLRYYYANPPYLRIFGLDIVGKNDFEIFGEENGELFRRQDHELLESGKPFVSNGPQYSYSRVAKGFYSLIKFPVTTRTGHRYIAGFITDITSEHDLLEKSKAAERAKSLFLASMSHEIRTPLNVIVGLAEELQHADITPAQRNDYVSSISTSSKALLALINDVLDMSKLEAGQMHMTPVRTHVSDLFRECGMIFTGNCEKKGLSIAFKTTPGIPDVMVDSMRLKQILFNLIGNAVKYTIKGGIIVQAHCEPAKDGKVRLIISVADTGIGISEEDAKTIFGLYEQATAMRGTRVANAGTGLGLCLAKRLALGMNGDIELTSAPGRGSVFSVVLNEITVAEPARSKPNRTEPAREGEGTLAKNGKVLIVDDVPMNLKVLGIVLKRLGVESVSASSGTEALIKLAKGGFGYVLTDMWMPEMSGEDLAHKIRENPAWAGIKIAAQTADVEASSNFEASLFDVILAKPLTADKVAEFLSD